MADRAPRSSWVWTRAVIAPAARRVLPVWIGTGIVAGVIFGPTGMSPRELTNLALGAPLVGLVLVATWLLLYIPTARVIVRAEAARYLRSLPSPRWPVAAMAIVALIGLQLPWLALWLLGAGPIGVAICVLVTILAAGIAWWRFAPPKTGALRWRGPISALVGIYARSLRRRAADALLRAAGLAVLAGIAAGLFGRNNELAPREAGVLAAAAIAVVLTPGWAGTLLPPIETHRDSAWLAASSGISEQARTAALAAIVVAIYLVTGAIAAVAATIVEPSPWTVPLALASSLGSALIATRAMIRAERSRAMTSRVVVGAIVASALAVVAFGALGATGALAMLAIGVLAVGTA
jgi:hypothetical protein